MRRYRQMLVLLLLAMLPVGCNWPLSHPETEPLAAARTSLPAVPIAVKEEGGSQATAPASTRDALTEFLSPPATAEQVATLPARADAPTHDGLFSGRSLHFELPAGFHALEGLDGGCFLYHERLPGFLVLYPQEGDPAETLAGLLNATPGLRRTEPPLEVDLGGLTFVGLFVETESGSRLFLAAAEGWALVAQGPAEDWPGLAAGLNRVLTSLSVEEDF